MMRRTCIQSVVLKTCGLILLLIAINVETYSLQKHRPGQEEYTLKGERVAIKKIVAELRQRKIIMKNNRLSVRITNDELVVDGKKQSAALHRLILQKYVLNPRQRLSYTYNSSVEYH